MALSGDIRLYVCDLERIDASYECLYMPKTTKFIHLQILFHDGPSLHPTVTVFG